MVTVCTCLTAVSAQTLVVLLLGGTLRQGRTDVITLDLEPPDRSDLILNDDPSTKCEVHVCPPNQSVPEGYRITNQVLSMKLYLTSIGEDDAMICNANGAREDSTSYAQSRHYGRYKVILRIPSHTNVTCYFYQEYMKEGQYKCHAVYIINSPWHMNIANLFQVRTTRRPDKFALVRGDNRNETYLTTIDLYEGTHESITCVLFNVKPLHNVQWTSNYGVVTAYSQTTNSHSISCVGVTARFLVSPFLHGKFVTCRAEHKNILGHLMSEYFARVQINVIHGPYDNDLIIRSSRERLAVTCPLISYPPITNFMWMRDNSLLRCSLRQCTFLLENLLNSTLSCEGKNPKTGVQGKVNIRVFRKQ